MANFCGSCGAKLNPGEKFCPNCGQPVSPAPIPSGNKDNASGYQRQDPYFSPVPPKIRRSPDILNLLNIVLAGVLFVESVLVCFWQPGVLRKDKPDLKPEETVAESTTASESGTEPGSAGGPLEDSEYASTLPEWIGHNEAYSFDPAEGVHVEVGKDVLYEDTELTVAPLTEATDQLLQLDEELKAGGEYIIGAWDVHAGLEPDQVLPGEYEVSFDLAALSIPEELYPALKLSRVTDDGIITEYDAVLEDGHLTYMTNQNSITLLSVIVAVAAGAAIFGVGVYTMDHLRENQYYMRDPLGFDFVWRENPYGKYSIRWDMLDLDYEQRKIENRIVDLEQAVLQEVEEEYQDEKWYKETVNDSGSLAWLYTSNRTKAQVLADKLKNNKEYMDLKSQLEVPWSVKYLASCIDLAYEYLATQAHVALPKWRLAYMIKKGGALGYSVDCTWKENHIEVNIVDDLAILLDDSPKGLEERDNLILTLTHETFHVCQTLYHTKYLTDSDRFDEMTAVLLEADAKKYFQDHDIIISDPPLTPLRWATLAVPIDYMNDDEKYKFEKETWQYQGYTLARFVMYLREITGKADIGAGDILKSRSYRKKPNTSGPIQTTFKMTKLAFENTWKAFCIEHRKDAAADYPQEMNYAEYTDQPLTKLKKNSGAHVSLPYRGNYGMAIRGFRQESTTEIVPLLVVLDPGTQEEDDAYLIIRVEDNCVTTPSGFYMPAQPDKKPTSEARLRCILEVYGSRTQAPEVAPGYTVWSLDAPEEPEVTLEKGKLNIQLPEPQGAAKAGVMDGLRLTIVCDGEKVKEEDIEKDAFGTLLAYDVDMLKDTEGEETPQFSVMIQEFVKGNNGEYCFGLPSVPSAPEKPKDDITPFLGQYEREGVTFDANGNRFIQRMIIKEDYIRLPNNGVNQLFYDSYEVDGDTLTVHFRDSDWVYVITMLNWGRISVTSQYNGPKDYSGSKNIWIPVPAGQEWEEWGEIYGH